MSLIAEFANETLTGVTPGLLSETDSIMCPDAPADPTMSAAFLTVNTCLDGLYTRTALTALLVVATG
ncbi:linaridin-like RiPP [Streptomyces sp. NPDC018972]|uniref:linaridin-like RiPP n=1 Tax=Streptomyces sp. NPDC018972 TaxID=3365060 RepID=UPI00378B50E1